jgi:hypothetical protein
MLLTKNEAPILLKLSEERFIGLQNFMYLYQAEFLKDVRMDQYCKVKVNILQKQNNNKIILNNRNAVY